MMEWEKRPGETEIAYHWFCKYRDMGVERSHAEVVQKYSKKPTYKSQLAKWSVKYDWVDRVVAYDQYMEEKKRAAIEDERMVAAREDISLAEDVLTKVKAKMAILEAEDMSIYDMRTLAEFAIKIRRDAMGVAQEFKITSDVSVTDKTAERVYDNFIATAERLLAMRSGDGSSS